MCYVANVRQLYLLCLFYVNLYSSEQYCLENEIERFDFINSLTWERQLSLKCIQIIRHLCELDMYTLLQLMVF